VQDFQQRSVASKVYQYIANPLIVIELINFSGRRPDERGAGAAGLRDKANKNNVLRYECPSLTGFALIY
jgi:hypothetical protein